MKVRNCPLKAAKKLFALSLCLVLLVVALVARARAEPKVFDEHAFYEFLVLCDRFDRHYRGCEEKGFEPCRVNLGTFDLKTWSEINERGRSLFANSEHVR